MPSLNRNYRGLLCNVQENYLQLAFEPGGMRTLGAYPTCPTTPSVHLRVALAIR